MKNIIKFGLFSLIAISFELKAAVKELTSISLNSGEVLIPSEQVESVTQKTLRLFDGRTIETTDIKNVEVMHLNGSSETFGKGFFKLIEVNAAKVGGDNSGGG